MDRTWKCAAAIVGVALVAAAVPAHAAPAVTTSTVVVHLSYADGTPAHPAYAYIPSVSLGATGDASGRAVVKGLPPNTTLQVCGDDLGSRPDKPDWPGALPTCESIVTPAAGAKTAVALRLDDAAGIDTTILMPDGQPMQSGYVMVGAPGQLSGQKLIDVVNGETFQNEIVPGAYTICGYDGADQGAGCAGGAFQPARAAVVDLPAGTRKHIDLRLSPAFSLNGQIVTTADGSAVPDVTVSVRNSAGALIARRPAGETDGYWSTELLPVRPVTVCATPTVNPPPPGAPAPTGVVPRCVPYSPPSPGDHTLAISLDAGGAIDGAITDQAGRAIGVATVELWQGTDSQTRRVRTVTADAQGRWTVGSLPAGSFAVCFRAPGLTTGTAPHGYTPRCWADKPYQPADADTVTVTAGQRTGPIVGRLIARQ